MIERFLFDHTRRFFSFSISNRDERAGVQGILNQQVNLFRIVSFIQGIKIRMSDPLARFQECFGVREIMDWLRYLQTGDDLPISIDRDRGFQE